MTRTIVAIVAFLVSFSQGSNAAADRMGQASDFGFRLSVQLCLTETVDTFTSMFTKELGGDPPRSATAQLSLSDAQMGTIYQTMEKIRLFDYPSQFDGVRDGLRAVTVLGPAIRYRLEVRNGGAVHAVSWNDAFKPTTEEADRLRAQPTIDTDWFNDETDITRAV